MANFFTDNADMQFHFKHMDLREIVSLKEGDFSESKEHPYAFTSYEDAMDGYRRVLDIAGGIAGDVVAPRALYLAGLINQIVGRFVQPV